MSDFSFAPLINYSVVDTFLGLLKDFRIASSFERVSIEMEPLEVKKNRQENH